MGLPYYVCSPMLVPLWWKPIQHAGYLVEELPEKIIADRYNQLTMQVRNWQVKHQNAIVGVALCQSRNDLGQFVKVYAQIACQTPLDKLTVGLIAMVERSVIGSGARRIGLKQGRYETLYRCSPYLAA